MDTDRKLDLILAEITLIKESLEGVDLQAVSRKVDSHDRQINALEKRVRRRNLLFFGIPEDDKEPVTSVMELIRSLGIAECSELDIEACYRRGAKSKLIAGRSRPIVAEFSSMRLKEKIYAERIRMPKPAYLRLDYPPIFKDSDGNSSSKSNNKRKDISPLAKSPKKPTKNA